ncbi:VOC family protein [Haliea sp. E17]|uniref:VOC family protein n=1 Tax=Haliea sp. E17 TaxID=3401576 RepID=UPI003AAA8A0B
MAIEGLNHVNLRAPAEQLRALRDFYVEVVGLEDGSRPDFGVRGYWLYAGGQPIIHMMVCREDGPAEVSASHSPVDHIALTCSDLAATERRLEKLGTPYRKNDFSAERGFVQLFLLDPAGLGVELNFSA